MKEGRPVAEPRVPFQTDFPHVVVQQPFGSPARPTAHPDYKGAKSGDRVAAARFADAMVTPEGVARVRKIAGTSKPTLVPVHAEESTGRNAIPIAYGAVLARRTGYPLDLDIVQANRVFRTGSTALHRMTVPVEFYGPIKAGTSYLLVDDHVSQGGTLADLRSYIENRGGRVVGATTLTGAPDGHKLAPQIATLEALRAQMPGIDDWMKGAFGHDLNSLTEAEARYLQRFNSLDSFRNQIFAAGQARRGSGDRSGTGEDRRGKGHEGGVAPSPDKRKFSLRDQENCGGLERFYKSFARTAVFFPEDKQQKTFFQRQREVPGHGRYRGSGADSKVFWFFSSEKNMLPL